MEEKMFCFQCEQTAGCSGCTAMAGVCGKKAETAVLQDKLTGALVSLAMTAEKLEKKEDGKAEAAAVPAALYLEGLFTTITNVNFNDESIIGLTETVRRTHRELLGGAEPGADYDMNHIWKGDEDIRSLKSLILFGLKGIAAYAWHAYVLDLRSARVEEFIQRALAALGQEGSVDTLLPVVMETGAVNLECMELLDRANTTAYGNPEPATVTLTVEKGPFIVVTGHDLKDLEELLEQTEGTGVNIYTHGEMLPAHGYPALRRFSHLKGNFGTAWQNQQKEFADIPGALLFTTNCLMPPRDSYRDRVFTTAMVDFPGISHINEGGDGKKDFRPVIEKALALGGYKEDMHFTGINGGSSVMTGFGHQAVLNVAPQVIEAVKQGAIRHFFLVGGCDGARPGRNYYTEFVRQTPADTVVLTLACGKYRFNDMDLGTIGGIPRLLDMGQCNDAYSAIKVAVALAEAFGCGVNELPLSFVLSWYEQKAVCILLTLLHLGIRNIKLGPSLPAFLSPNVLDLLVKEYGIGPITTPEADMAEFLK